MSEQRAASSKQRPGGLYVPKQAHVRLVGGVPRSINGKRVEAVREEWLVEDRWWTAAALRRHYLELVLESGRCLVVFRDLETGEWFEQR